MTKQRVCPGRARILLSSETVRHDQPDDPQVEQLLRAIIAEEVQLKAAKREHGTLRLLVRDLRRKHA